MSVMILDLHRQLGGEFGYEGGEEVRGGGAGGGELRFQRVHPGHQLLHFGHDPALFGEGWDFLFMRAQGRQGQVQHSGSPGAQQVGFPPSQMDLGLMRCARFSASVMRDFSYPSRERQGWQAKETWRSGDLERQAGGREAGDGSGGHLRRGAEDGLGVFSAVFRGFWGLERGL